MSVAMNQIISANSKRLDKTDTVPDDPDNIEHHKIYDKDSQNAAKSIINPSANVPISNEQYNRPNTIKTNSTIVLGETLPLFSPGINRSFASSSGITSDHRSDRGLDLSGDMIPKRQISQRVDVNDGLIKNPSLHLPGERVLVPVDTTTLFQGDTKPESKLKRLIEYGLHSCRTDKELVLPYAGHWHHGLYYSLQEYEELMNQSHATNANHVPILPLVSRGKNHYAPP